MPTKNWLRLRPVHRPSSNTWFNSSFYHVVNRKKRAKLNWNQSNYRDFRILRLGKGWIEIATDLTAILSSFGHGLKKTHSTWQWFPNISLADPSPLKFSYPCYILSLNHFAFFSSIHFNEGGCWIDHNSYFIPTLLWLCIYKL